MGLLISAVLPVFADKKPGVCPHTEMEIVCRRTDKRSERADMTEISISVLSNIMFCPFQSVFLYFFRYWRYGTKLPASQLVHPHCFKRWYRVNWALLKLVSWLHIVLIMCFFWVLKTRVYSCLHVHSLWNSNQSSLPLAYMPHSNQCFALDVQKWISHWSVTMKTSQKKNIFISYTIMVVVTNLGLVIWFEPET